MFSDEEEDHTTAVSGRAALRSRRRITAKDESHPPEPSEELRRYARHAIDAFRGCRDLVEVMAEGADSYMKEQAAKRGKAERRDAAAEAER